MSNSWQAAQFGSNEIVFTSNQGYVLYDFQYQYNARTYINILEKIQKERKQEKSR